MRTGANQALRTENDANADLAGMSEGVGKLRAVRLAVLGTKHEELLPKEIICCNMATD